MTPVPASNRSGPAPLTPPQLAMLREQLEQQRQFRLEQLDSLQRDSPRGPGTRDDVQDVLVAGARAALHDVLTALHRMDTGSYGTCADCGTLLPLERLEVLPQVGQCLRCRQAAGVRAGR